MIEPAGFEPVTRRERREKEEFSRALLAATPTVWGTASLVVINAAVFTLMVVRGVSLIEPTIEDLLRFGADYGPVTASGQWWRVVSSAFVHIGVVHLLLNMWGLWQGGQLAERFYGHGPYLTLYIASAIGGSLTSLAWNPGIVSAGASGAIFGVYGALLAVVVLHRREIPAAIFQDLRKSTVAVVGYNVFYGFVTPEIDNAAHLGGLATGFVVGVCLRRPMPELGSAAGPSAEPIAPARTGVRTQLVRLAPVVIGLALAAVGAKRRVEAAPEVRSERHFDLAVEAWGQGDTSRAMAELDAALALQPDDARSWSLRGELVWAGGDRGGASECYRKAIALAPDYAYPRLRLGWTEQDAGNLQAAHAEFTRAIELDLEYTDAYFARGWVRAQTGRALEALDDYDRALALDPGNEDARLHRAHTLRDLGRHPEALPVFQEHAAKDDERALLSALVAWTLRARLGDRDAASAELRTRLGTYSASNPEARIGSFLLGELEQDSLLAEIEGRDRRSPNGQPIELCNARYFVGVKALLDGEDQRARDSFQQSLLTRAIDTPLFAGAQAEIAELER